MGVRERQKKVWFEKPTKRAEDCNLLILHITSFDEFLRKVVFQFFIWIILSSGRFTTTKLTSNDLF